ACYVAPGRQMPLREDNMRGQGYGRGAHARGLGRDGGGGGAGRRGHARGLGRHGGRRGARRLLSVGVLAALVLGVLASAASASVGLTLQSTPSSFSPNGDGQEDSLTVSYCLDVAANVTAEVRTGAN